MNKSGWNSTADIVIIGGGIIGCSTAYFLTERGNHKIILLEKDLLAQASTGLCVGGIRQQFSNPANIILSQETLRIFKKFNEELGVPIDFCQTGYLFLAQKKNTWKDFLSSIKLQHQYNVPVDLLSPEQIRSLWPYLETKDILGGTFCPDDGYADPYSVTLTLANIAKKSGVKIFEKTKVLDIEINENRLMDVRTSNGKISTPIVINAAGAWGGEIARMVGLNLPVKPYRRQVFATKAFNAMVRPVPMVIDQDELFYFRGEGPTIIMGMSDPQEPPSFNTHVDRQFLEKLITVAIHRAPILEQAEIQRGWGGLYAITPDENPIIGHIKEIEGFYCAVGFSGHGFQHGPAVGQIISQLVLEGKSDFDLHPFAYDRFGKNQGRGEKKTI